MFRPTVLFLFVLPVAAHAQLPDDFSRSAFKVAKMVEAEAGQYSLSDSGGILVPKETSSAINDLDADAATKDEQAVVSTLRAFFMSRLEHNMTLRTLKLRAETLLISKNLPRGSVNVAELAATSPTVSAIHDKESQCANEIDEALRTRKWREIAACAEDQQIVTTPDDPGFVLKQ